jgi:hypothetical protein
MPQRFSSNNFPRVIPLLVALAAMSGYAFVAQWRWYPPLVDLTRLADGTITEAQGQAVDMVKELNTYLISTTTLLLGGLGWYLSQYKPPKSRIVHTAFFASVAFVVLALVYAGMTNVELTDELAQNSLALGPGRSSILFYLEREIWTCGIAAVLMLGVFTDAVTKGKL